jgi:hypothetical protein
VRRPNTKGNIITVYAIQRDIHRSEIDDIHCNNVDVVLASCWVTASGEFMERAGYPPISPDISPRIRSRLSGIGRSWTALNPPFDSIVGESSIPVSGRQRRPTEQIANSLKRLRLLKGDK